MKYALAAAAAVVLLATAYFVVNPGTTAAPPQPVRVSPANPFLNPKPVDIPFNTDKAEYAKKLFADGRYQEVVSVCAGLSSSDASHQTKAMALLMAAQALVQANDPASLRYARELYELYLEQFPKEGSLDSAHYNLGLIAVADANGPTALLHFTSLLQEYPESRFAPNAAFFARQIAGVIERQHETPKGKVMRILGPVLPSNTAALVGLLTSFASVLVWFFYNWETHYDKLFVRKDPLVWSLLIMLVALATTNYLFEDRENAKSMLDATKALSALKR